MKKVKFLKNRFWIEPREIQEKGQILICIASRSKIRFLVQVILTPTLSGLDIFYAVGMVMVRSY